MKKLYISIINGLILCFVFNNVVFGQWSFTPSISYSGNCSQNDPTIRNYANQLNTIIQQLYSQYVSFPDRNTCNQFRNQMLNYSKSDGSCAVRIVCTQCSGSDIATPTQGTKQSSTGSLNINGTSQGGAFFSSSPSKETKDWINNVTQKLQSLGISNNLSNFIPTTGNKDFDAMYGNLMKDENKTEEFTVLPKGSGSSGVVLDDTKGLTVKDAQRGVPVAPSIDNDRYMLLSGIEHDIQSKLAELDRINRYCDKYPSDCGSFQKRKEELEKEIGDAKNNLSNLKTDDYMAEIEKYRQQLLDYNSQRDKCENELCRNQIDQAKEAINEKITNVSNELSGLKSEIDNIKSNDYGTEYDKRDAIADMRMDRINEQLKNGEITYSVANSMMANVQAEKREIDAERTVTDAYSKVKENVINPTTEFVAAHKNAIITGGEVLATTAVSIGGAVLAPETGGGSVMAAAGLNFEISTYANELRGQGLGEASFNSLITTSISTGAGIAASELVPVGRSVFHMNTQGQVAYVTNTATTTKNIVSTTTSIATSGLMSVAGFQPIGKEK